MVVASCGEPVPAAADELPARLAGRTTGAGISVSAATAVTSVRVLEGLSSSGPTNLLFGNGRDPDVPGRRRALMAAQHPGNDVYRHHAIDTDSIVSAALDVLD